MATAAWSSRGGSSPSGTRCSTASCHNPTAWLAIRSSTGVAASSARTRCISAASSASSADPPGDPLGGPPGGDPPGPSSPPGPGVPGSCSPEGVHKPLTLVSSLLDNRCGKWDDLSPPAIGRETVPTRPGPVPTGRSEPGSVLRVGAFSPRPWWWRMLPASATVRVRQSLRCDISTDDTRINDRIRAREVLLIGGEGEQLGVKPLPEAISIARAAELDLVEVAPNANPPVCRLMDYKRYEYEQQQRRKESRRKATQVVIKEMKFRPKIDVHDYTTKMRHVERFLAEGNKVKLTIMFRGREMAHPELGLRILERIADEVSEIAMVEAAPRQDGRNMTMVLHPLKQNNRRPSTTTKAPKPAAPPAAAPAATPAATAAPVSPKHPTLQ